MPKRLSKRIIVKRMLITHDGKYKYPGKYKGLWFLMKIICPEHGEFEQRPGDHVNGRGCRKCAKCFLDKDMFIKNSNIIHRYKYDYSLVNYKTSNTHVKIICPKHGIFTQQPNNHQQGDGCPGCTLPSKNYRGFSVEKPAILYYFLDPISSMFKIGITNKKTTQVRFGKSFCKERGLVIIKEEPFALGLNAYNKEQSILEEFSLYRKTNETWPREKGGKTEFFTKDIFKEAR